MFELFPKVPKLVERPYPKAHCYYCRTTLSSMVDEDCSCTCHWWLKKERA